MSDKLRLEQRLKDFYDRVPDIEDALPFKDYVLKHEDSRMAWYLLGKQYAAKGQDAKANYCFHQAGEIYEAFENKPVPATVPGSFSMWRADRRRRTSRPAAVAVAVLLLGAVYMWPGGKAAAPGHTPEWKSPQSEAVGADVQPDNARTLTPEAGIISAAVDPAKDGRTALGELLTQKPQRTPLVLVEAVSMGGWIDWLASGKPVASVTAVSASGNSLVTWYDPAWCGCLPGKTGDLPQAVQDWKPLQEQKLLLVSAVARYREKYGKMPNSPKALTGNYPANHMAGWTNSMSGWFAELTGSKAAAGGATGWPSGSGSGRAVPAGAWHSFTDHPMEIWVDTVHHRLAVVSGRVLLRNYEVGLGGVRTPLGGFTITEKVRNPNGKTKGPFGSRGMTLSDSRYAIHGTDDTGSIGKDESEGCIRMNKSDLEELYDLVPIGTKVKIAKGGLPAATRVPPERFRLPNTHDETNPRKKYDWLT